MISDHLLCTLVIVLVLILIADTERAEAELYGLPLKIFSKTKWEPYLTLQDFDSLKGEKSFIVGTSMHS